jgi:hypothetical protein
VFQVARAKQEQSLFIPLVPSRHWQLIPKLLIKEFEQAAAKGYRAL